MSQYEKSLPLSIYRQGAERERMMKPLVEGVLVRLKHLVYLAATCVLAACVSLPEELQLPEEQVLVGFGQVIQAPTQHVGQMVRWGGVIAEVENKSDHTLIEVTYYPLRPSGRPNVDELRSSGRYRAKISGLADPMVYKKGKAITFVGSLGAPIESQIGEFNYTFPLILSQQHVLWEELPDYDEHYYYHHRWHHYPYPYYRPSRWHGYSSIHTSSGKKKTVRSNATNTKSTKKAGDQPAEVTRD